MNNQDKMIRWLLDVIDTEVAKPDEEADMALVEECTALLGELTGETCSLSERELKKRCRAITHGGKNVWKRLRLTAAIAACLAVFVIMSGCGYLPSITTIIQTIFASGIGKDVEVHEITYTFEGMAKQYTDIKDLIYKENLDILIPEILPEDTYIINIVNDPENNNIFVLFNNNRISFQIFTNGEIEDYITIPSFDKHLIEDKIIYSKKMADMSYIAYSKINDKIYFVSYSNINTILNVLNSLR